MLSTCTQYCWTSRNLLKSPWKTHLTLDLILAFTSQLDGSLPHFTLMAHFTLINLNCDFSSNYHCDAFELHSVPAPATAPASTPALIIAPTKYPAPSFAPVSTSAPFVCFCFYTYSSSWYINFFYCLSLLLFLLLLRLLHLLLLLLLLSLLMLIMLLIYHLSWSFSCSCSYSYYSSSSYYSSCCVSCSYCCSCFTPAPATLRAPVLKT